MIQKKKKICIVFRKHILSWTNLEGGVEMAALSAKELLLINARWRHQSTTLEESLKVYHFLLAACLERKCDSCPSSANLRRCEDDNSE